MLTAAVSAPTVCNVEPVRVSPPRRLIVEAGRAAWWDRTSLVVCHVGGSAVLLEAPSQVHLVADHERGLVPDGALLPELVDFTAFREAAILALGSQRPLDLTTWTGIHPARVTRRSLGLTALIPSPQAVQALADCLVHADAPPAAGINPAPLRRLAPVLAHAARSGQHERDPHPLNGLLLRLVGAGPGATPTGDDVLVGMLAGFHALAGSGADPGAAPAAEAIAREVTPLVHRTAAASGQELRAAAEGRFCSRVQHLVAGACDPVLAARAAAAAAHWGATSGIDLLHGLVAALAESPILTPHTLAANPLLERRSA